MITTQKNLHHEFQIDGHWGIVIGGWYLVGVCLGEMDRYGIIIFDWFVGLDTIDTSDM